jgi:hypothetical protein
MAKCKWVRDLNPFPFDLEVKNKLCYNKNVSKLKRNEVNKMLKAKRILRD